MKYAVYVLDNRGNLQLSGVFNTSKQASKSAKQLKKQGATTKVFSETKLKQIVANTRPKPFSRF